MNIAYIFVRQVDQGRYHSHTASMAEHTQLEPHRHLSVYLFWISLFICNFFILLIMDKAVYHYFVPLDPLNYPIR
jgi:ABC-type Fe3+ transport system permease subunit